MAIKVIYGTNTSRSQDIISEDTLIREFVETRDCFSGNGSLHLDGITLRGVDLDQTFAQAGCSVKATLIEIVKADSAGFENLALKELSGDIILDIAVDAALLSEFGPLKLQDAEGATQYIAQAGGTPSFSEIGFNAPAVTPEGKCRLLFASDGDVWDAAGEFLKENLTALLKLDKLVPLINADLEEADRTYKEAYAAVESI